MNLDRLDVNEGMILIGHFGHFKTIRFNVSETNGEGFAEVYLDKSKIQELINLLQTRLVEVDNE